MCAHVAGFKQSPEGVRDQDICSIFDQFQHSQTFLQIARQYVKFPLELKTLCYVDL